MKRTLIASAVAAALVVASAWAASGTDETVGAGDAATFARPAPQWGPGMGAGMMRRGHGPGMMGRGYGPMGPGMMGQGYGPGMMGRGSGPMGPGMMGPGYGPGGMGGMMHGAAYAALDLSDEQRAKIAEIQDALRQTHWALMGAMHESRQKLLELEREGRADDAAAREAYDAMSAVRQTMLATMRDAQQRIEALLTQEQRDQLTRGERAG